MYSCPPTWAHEKLTNFIVGMNRKYERKDEEDCNNGGNGQVGKMKTRKARNKVSKRKRSRKTTSIICLEIEITVKHEISEGR